MEKKDWLLLYTSLPVEGNVVELDPIRIMKGMFLFTMAVEKQGKTGDIPTYDFEPYLYGPCAFEIYADLDSLVSEGLLEREEPPFGRTWPIYRPTELGKARAKELQGQAPAEVVPQMANLKSEVVSLSFNQLLRRVYAEHPKYAGQSVLRPRGGGS